MAATLTDDTTSCEGFTSQCIFRNRGARDWKG